MRRDSVPRRDWVPGRDSVLRRDSVAFVSPLTFRRSAAQLRIAWAVLLLLGLIAQPVVVRAQASSAASSSPSGNAAPQLSGEATLQLQDVLKLQRSLEDAQAKPPSAPPVRAALQRADFTGTLLQDALEVEASFEIVVLADDDWTRVELFEVSDATHLGPLPAIQRGMLALRDGKLELVTRHAGRHALDVRFVARAAIDGARRSARVALPEASPAELRVRFSPASFRLLQEPLRQDADGALFLPRQGAFEIAWQSLESLEPASAASAPPAVADPTIPRAHASSVSTLEGTRITRIAYELRFSGRRAVSFEVPAGDTVQHVYLNGRSVPFSLEERRLEVEVAPARSGGDQARLELVLTRELPYFLLSGALSVQLPAPSWPTSELHLDVYVPQVFDYAWAGGSLSPVDETPHTSFVYAIPEPGKRLSFHQYLIRSAAPDVTLQYTVDLDGGYFER